MDSSKFDDIAPLRDDQVEDGIQALLTDPGFEHAVRYIMPNIDWEEFSAVMSSYKNKYQFQSDAISNTVGMLGLKSTKGFRGKAWENIDKSKEHLFLSNHRDIVLDAGFLNVLLDKNGYNTTEIAIGDNLLIHPWIRTLVRLNKSFIVRRGLPVREQMVASMHMSEYIHYCINQKGESVWMAQREGRAKDANDYTQPSLLKMLTLYPDRKEFIKGLKQLNIIPVSISYEYDPCDYLKAKEFQQKRDIPGFKKTQRDDLLNMEIGILGYKGNVVFRFGECINDKLDLIQHDDPREVVKLAAEVIDRVIHTNYEIYPVNYMAYDLLYKQNRFTDKYTQSDIDTLEDYLLKQIDKIDEIEVKDIPFLRERMLEMYSNVLKNHLLATNQNL